MKKTIFKLMAATMIVSAVFTSCNEPENNPADNPENGNGNGNGNGNSSTTTDVGVVINGIKWATRNVDEPGTFTANPQDVGKYYQWNRKKAWASNGDVTGWDSSTPEGDTWEKANDPCPSGWRVPTQGEMEGLMYTSSEWVRLNGMAGRLFSCGNYTLFLPAAGFRDGGELVYRGSIGCYWTNRSYGNTQAQYGYFTSAQARTFSVGHNLYRTDGFSVRCVKDE